MDVNTEIDWYRRAKYELNQDLKSGGISQDEYTAGLLDINRERKEERAAIAALPVPKPPVIEQRQERQSWHGMAVAKRRRAQRLRRGNFFTQSVQRRLSKVARTRKTNT